MVLVATDDVVRVEPEHVPDVLKQAARWCCWRREPTKSGTLTKKPMQPRWPSRGLSKTTPAHWSTFTVAVEAYTRNRGHKRTPLDGIGFITGGGIVALDFDECCDEVTRDIRPDVAEWLRRLNTYAEFSPSGRGVRAFVRGVLPGNNVTSKDAGFELYGEDAYVTVTGFRVPGTPDEVAEGSELLADMCTAAEEAVKAAKAARKASSARTAATACPEKPVQGAGRLPTPPASGQRDVFALAMSSAQSAAIDRLWRGDWQGAYKSQSEAELALANYLAFYAGPGGEAEVERLMRESGLKRDKFDNSLGEGRTYLSHTVATAFAGRADFYTGKASTAKKAAAEVVLPNGMASTGPTALNDSSTLTDVGLARRLVLEARGTLRYVVEWKSWLWWDGKRWVRDDGLAAAHVAKQTSDRLWHEAAELPAERRGQLSSFLKAAASSRGIDAAVRLARSEPGVVVSADELDRNPYLLNVRNGTLNLLTAELLPHNPANLLTHMAGTEFNPTASCPAFRQFIDAVTDGDKELAAFHQRSCGLALSADVTEQVLWLHYGEGRNGKSTLLTVVSELLGSYAGPAPLEMLLVKGRGREVETQFASLAGRRLVTAVEADSGMRFSEATVKLLTGGDTVLARRLYEDAWPLRPSWKLHISANHKPLVRGTDEGIWRRLMLCPWVRRFEGAAQDTRLKDKLLAELPGILNWCLAGFAQWRDGQKGLMPPASVLAATKGYRAENDVLGGWQAECCLVGPHAVGTANELYASFKEFCEQRGEYVTTAKAFGQELERRGLGSERPTSGPYRFKTIWRGIGLLDVANRGE